jgi:hypothetical protein
MEEIERREENEDDRIHRILSKAIVIQALYAAVIENRVNWELLLCIDDLTGFGKTIIFLPKTCLDRQRVLEFIDEVRRKEGERNEESNN